jgi:hypothetical protein
MGDPSVLDVPRDAWASMRVPSTVRRGKLSYQFDIVLVFILCYNCQGHVTYLIRDISAMLGHRPHGHRSG